MIEKVQDMSLPGATVQKIIKDALPDGIGVAKDARIAISKAATVFGMFLNSPLDRESKSLRLKKMNKYTHYKLFSHPQHYI